MAKDFVKAEVDCRCTLCVFVGVANAWSRQKKAVKGL